MGMFVFIAIGVLLLTGGIVCTVAGLRRIVAASGGDSPGASREAAPAARQEETSEARPLDEAGSPWVIRCAKCDRKLRIPHGRGTLQVVCPRCETRFGFDSNAGQVVS